MKLPRIIEVPVLCGLIALLALLAPKGVWSSQPAVTASNTAIWLEPKRSSAQQAQLVKGSELTLIKRHGGWYQVETANNQTGWIPLLNVRFISEQEDNERSIAEILRQTAEMPTAAGRTSGVRGMTDEALDSEVQQSIDMNSLNNFVPTEEDMETFRRQGQLNSNSDIVPAAPAN